MVKMDQMVLQTILVSMKKLTMLLKKFLLKQKCSAYSLEKSFLRIVKQT